MHLTSGRHPPWVSSHCKQAKLPVAAASCAGLAPLFARQFPGRPASSTRKRRQFSFPARAAWWTGDAPSTSLTSSVSAFAANCALRVWTSPCLAASSVLSPSATMSAADRTTPSLGYLGWARSVHHVDGLSIALTNIQVFSVNRILLIGKTDRSTFFPQQYGSIKICSHSHAAHFTNRHVLHVEKTPFSGLYLSDKLTCSVCFPWWRGSVICFVRLATAWCWAPVASFFFVQ